VTATVRGADDGQTDVVVGCYLPVGEGAFGGAGFGAIPVVAGGLVSVPVVLLGSPPVNTRASIAMTSRAPAIHHHGVGASAARSSFIRRSKSRGSVMIVSRFRFSMEI
jgi:hypothetical protein